MAVSRASKPTTATDPSNPDARLISSSSVGAATVVVGVGTVAGAEAASAFGLQFRGIVDPILRSAAGGRSLANKTLARKIDASGRICWLLSLRLMPWPCPDRAVEARKRFRTGPAPDVARCGHQTPRMSLARELGQAGCCAPLQVSDLSPPRDGRAVRGTRMRRYPRRRSARTFALYLDCTFRLATQTTHSQGAVTPVRRSDTAARRTRSPTQLSPRLPRG